MILINKNAAWADADKVRRDTEYRNSSVGHAEQFGHLTSAVAGQALKNGEVTVAWGGTVGFSAGVTGDIAAGNFFSLDFKDMTLVTGFYGSAEAGAALGIPLPSLNHGMEISVYPSSNYEDALSGEYTIHGGDYDFGPVNVDIGEIRPKTADFSGVQLTLGGGISPKMLKSPIDFSAYLHAGTGGIDNERINTYQLKWW